MTEELRDEVIVLGCGPSILELSEEDRSYIASCKYRIALNKFAAFHELAGIRPTHIFFIDNYDESCRNWLQYIFSKTILQGQAGTTFVVSKQNTGAFRRCNDEDTHVLARQNYFRDLHAAPFLWKEVLGDQTHAFLVPQDCKLEFVSHTDWLVGGRWAKDLTDPLFHFRGSLTSLLNYASICCPGKDVRLVGTDFYSGSAFFATELEKVAFQGQDWTTEITRQENKHFSAIKHEGRTMFDRFPFVIARLLESGNTLSCISQKSLLVTCGFVPYSPLTSDLIPHPADYHSALSIWHALVAQISDAIQREAADRKTEQKLLAKTEVLAAEVNALRGSVSWKFGHAIVSFLASLLPRRSQSNTTGMRNGSGN